MGGKGLVIGIVVSAACLEVARTQSSAPLGDVEGSIAGRVLAKGSGEPLFRATLLLRPVPTAMTPQGVEDMLASSYHTSSESSGEFQFWHVRPGKYFLSCERSGYVRQNYGGTAARPGGTPIEVGTRQALKDMIFLLNHEGRVGGKVSDEQGEAVIGATVQAISTTYGSDGRRQYRAISNATVDADGAFVIAGLGPGRYYIKATVKPRNGSIAQDDLSGGTNPEEGYLMTYYPNTPSAAGAAAIEVSSGSDLRGIDIRMRKSPVFSVRGKVIDPTGRGRFSDLLVSLGSLGAGPEDRRLGTLQSTDGRFEFRNVPSGTYVLRATPRGGGKTADLIGREVVNVIQNTDNVPLHLGYSLEVRGKVEIVDEQPQSQSPKAQVDGARSTPPPRRITITLLPEDASNAKMVTAHVSEDDTFVLQGIALERFAIGVYGLNPGDYLKAATYAGRNALRTYLEFTGGVQGDIVVSISPNAGDISGRVHGSRGEVLSSGVMVSVWPKDVSSDSPVNVARAVYTDQDGRFVVANLAPGKYYVVAWEDIEAGLTQNASFRNAFSSQGAVVTIAENSHEAVDLRVTSKEAIALEAVKVQ